jgi:phosphatidylglycerophosphatase A
MNFRDRAVVSLATGFSVGRVPRAPGTFGTLLGIPICYALSGIGVGATALIVGALILFAVWVAGRAERLLGQKDAACIVIDEIAGMVVALAGMSATPFNLAAGFIAFRAFDIIKPFPARQIDRQMAGGWGTVLDDVVAGAYANISLRVLSFFFQEATAWAG